MVFESMYTKTYKNFSNLQKLNLTRKLSIIWKKFCFIQKRLKGIGGSDIFFFY